MATAILWGFTYLLTTDMLPHHPALVIGDFGGGITATNVVAFILLTPVTALVLDAVFKGIIPTAIQFLGVAIVMAALVVNYLASGAAQK